MEERELRERWAATWAAAGPELEAIKWREMVEADPAETLRLLAPVFAYALRALPVRTTSGAGLRFARDVNVTSGPDAFCGAGCLNVCGRR